MHQRDARPGDDRSASGQRLAGRTALVTGGSSGIGRAIAGAFAAAGARVLLSYRRNRAGADDAVAQIAAAGGQAEAFQADVGTEAGVAALAAEVARRAPAVDIWCNNAGADILTGEGGTLDRQAKLQLVLDVDLRGTVLASWAAVTQMRGQAAGGVILNMSWDHVFAGMAGENPGLYAAAKGGVLAFSKSLARDVAPALRVNVLAPGFIDTAFGAEADAAWRRHVEAITPLGRWGTPADIAGAAVYLASDEAKFVTGQVVLVNGGVVM